MCLKDYGITTMSLSKSNCEMASCFSPPLRNAAFELFLMDVAGPRQMLITYTEMTLAINAANQISPLSANHISVEECCPA